MSETPRKESEDRAPTADRLRAEIDHGRAGDKVAASDPATVPLGADAEAGGIPPTEEELRLAREQELRRPDSGEGPRARRPDRRWAIGALALLLILVLLAGLIL